MREAEETLVKKSGEISRLLEEKQHLRDQLHSESVQFDSKLQNLKTNNANILNKIISTPYIISHPKPPHALTGFSYIIQFCVPRRLKNTPGFVLKILILLVTLHLLRVKLTLYLRNLEFVPEVAPHPLKFF